MRGYVIFGWCGGRMGGTGGGMQWVGGFAGCVWMEREGGGACSSIEWVVTRVRIGILATTLGSGEGGIT